NIFAAAARKPANGSDGHVVVAQDLTTEPHTGQATGRQDILLGLGHLVRLAPDELHPASRAPGVAAAPVKLIDLGLVLQRQDHAFALRHLEYTSTLDG